MTDFKRNVLISALAAFLGVASVPPSLSEEEAMLSVDDLSEMSLEELLNVTVLTIATGVKQTLARAPAVASVITADDIEAMGATDLDEVLETVPGLHVARYEGGYMSIYTVRGIYSMLNPEVLILVNGISIKHLYLGNRGPMGVNMPVNAIARIEIIRGPGSAVFGADAFAGVINITTKTKKIKHNDSETGELDGMETGLRAGSFDTREGWILHGGNWAGFDTALLLNYRTTEGQREQIDADAQTNFDKLFGTDASFAPGPVNLGRRSFDTRLDISRGKWQLRAAYQGGRNWEVGGGNAQALDPNARLAENRFTTNLTYHDSEFTENWDITAQVSYMDGKGEWKRDLTLYPPGAMGGVYPDGVIVNPSIAERHTRVDMSAFYSGFKKHRIRTGAGYHYGDLYRVAISGNHLGIDPATGNPVSDVSSIIDYSDTPYSFLTEGDRNLWYLFVQDAWEISPDWEFTSGLRFDEYSDFGTTLNPRLALVWQTLPNLTIKVLYGHAFRAPSFLELYAINNPVALGNPDLAPETIETKEVAFNYLPAENLNFSLNLFSYNIRDAIRNMPDPAAAGTFKAQNAGSRKGYGAELEAKWRINRAFSVSGNYARQKSTDEESDHDVGNAPHHQVYVRGNWRFLPKWRFNVQANWVADRDRVAGDPRPEIDDYTTVDLTLRRKDPKNWNFAVSVRNLFDEDAREPSQGPDTTGVIGIPNDLPLAGRSYFAEVSYHF
ncbi:MAG: TonB-dependent receptor [Gammaproteobacteria bacterium]|nr:TonB-dependent receptor [Gammaproteobacteria bacterium]